MSGHRRLLPDRRRSRWAVEVRHRWKKRIREVGQKNESCSIVKNIADVVPQFSTGNGESHDPMGVNPERSFRRRIHRAPLGCRFRVTGRFFRCERRTSAIGRRIYDIRFKDSGRKLGTVETCVAAHFRARFHPGHDVRGTPGISSARSARACTGTYPSTRCAR
jgi:hypothetical protein